MGALLPLVCVSHVLHPGFLSARVCRAGGLSGLHVSLLVLQIRRAVSVIASVLYLTPDGPGPLRIGAVGVLVSGVGQAVAFCRLSRKKARRRRHKTIVRATTPTELRL